MSPHTAHLELELAEMTSPAATGGCMRKIKVRTFWVAGALDVDLGTQDVL